MNTSITTFFKIGFFVGAVVLSSCSEKSDETTDSKETKVELKSLAKRWILSDDRDKNKNVIEVILSMEENGYFMIYDTITDKKFIDAGINKIQPVSKGQWKINDGKLVLSHIMDDSTRIEEFSIQSLNSDKLIIIGSNNKKHIYLSN